MADIEKSKPEFVSRDGMIASAEYVEWLSTLKQRYRQSQIKAVVRINQSMLEFYWSLGHDMVAMQAESKWGSGFFAQLSRDLKETFPNETGFSERNIRYIKKWYLFYFETITKMHQLGAKLLQQPAAETAGSGYIPIGRGCRTHDIGIETTREKEIIVPLWLRNNRAH